MVINSTNKTDRHDITEILLKVALNTTNLSKTYKIIQVSHFTCHNGRSE